MDDCERQILALPQVQRILELIGLVTTSWNEVESLWYLIYTCLLHEAPRKKVDQIYKQFQPGSAQRQFVMALADVAFSSEPEFRKETGKLNAETNKIASLRNNVIHGLYWFDPLNGPAGLRVAPMGSMRRKPNPLAKVRKELERELTSIFERIDSLSKRPDDFRLILSQEYLPEEKRTRPLSAKVLDAMPPEIRESLPRYLRERVASQRFRSRDKE